MTNFNPKFPLMTVVVCGGRDYRHGSRVRSELDRLHKLTPFGRVLHGCAGKFDRDGSVLWGADLFAGEWAKLLKIPVDAYRAHWALYGKSAGPIRNQLMIDEGKPDMVIAFPGGNGTNDMVRRALIAIIGVIDLRDI